MRGGLVSTLLSGVRHYVDVWVGGGGCKGEALFPVMDCAGRRPQSCRSAGNQSSRHGGMGKVSVWGGGVEMSLKGSQRRARMCHTWFRNKMRLPVSGL